MILIALLFSDMSKPHREIKDLLCHIKEAGIEQFKMSFLLDWSLNRFTFVNIWKKIREKKVGRIRYLYSILYSFSIFLAQLGLVIYFHPFASVTTVVVVTISHFDHLLRNYWTCPTTKLNRSGVCEVLYNNSSWSL